MSVARTDVAYSAGARSRKTYVVVCNHEGCWESVVGGVTGLPLPSGKEARRVAAVKGWAVWPGKEESGKDYCPEHREQHEDGEG